MIELGYKDFILAVDGREILKVKQTGDSLYLTTLGNNAFFIDAPYNARMVPTCPGSTSFELTVSSTTVKVKRV